MSKTIVDMPKVTQMLDAGWTVTIFKGPMGSYEVRARHPNGRKMDKTEELLRARMEKNEEFLKETGMTEVEAVELMDFDDGWLMTDDFTPEQALTRMAYKTFGEIL